MNQCKVSTVKCSVKEETVYKKLECVFNLGKKTASQEEQPHGETKGFPGGSDGKEYACSAKDPGSIPGLGRSPGEENGYPLQYSDLDNSILCLVHGVAESRI